MRAILYLLVMVLSSAFVCLAHAEEWRGIVPGDKSGWTRGPWVPEGATIYISASGTVCCARPRNPWADKKCRQPDTRHGEGALVISLPGYENMKYADFEPMEMRKGGYLRFWVEDKKQADNYGSYSVTVEW
jgi:hypothetical protein